MTALHTYERTQEAINLHVMRVACQCWNAGDLAGYLQLYHQAAVQYGSLAVEEGIASIRQSYESFWRAFPQSQLIFDDLFAAANKVACRYRVQARHQGEFLGIPASGRAVTLCGITLLHFVDGQCRERWSQSNFMGFLRSIEAVL